MLSEILYKLWTCIYDPDPYDEGEWLGLTVKPFVLEIAKRGLMTAKDALQLTASSIMHTAETGETIYPIEEPDGISFNPKRICALAAKEGTDAVYRKAAEAVEAYLMKALEHRDPAVYIGTLIGKIIYDTADIWATDGHDKWDVVTGVVYTLFAPQ